jgi:hypothetical protein
MKKLILLLLFIPLVSCDSELTRGETIDKMNRDVQSFLPYDFNNGIVWIKAINEDNLRSVKIYDVSEEGISVVENYISKSQIMEELKAVPKKAGYKTSQENKIVNVWRYYNNNTLIKEIIVYPQEWE